MRSESGRTFTEDARRTQIIDCAVALIAEVGYPQASLAKIAERAGIAKSAVLYYFRTKDDLVGALVEKVFGASATVMVPRIAAAQSATDKLAAYVDANGEFLDMNRLPAIALFEVSTSYRTADGLRLDRAAARSVADDGVPEELALLDPEAIFSLGISTGEFRSDLGARDAKNALRGALDAAVAELSRDPGFDVVGYVAAVKRLFLAGVRP